MLAVTALASGCGSESRADCRQADEQLSRRAITVADALDRDGELVLVGGTLVAPDSKPTRLCEGGRCLRLSGLRDLAAFDGPLESVRIAGRVDSDVLRVLLSCRTAAVRDRFADETGLKLSLNTFASNDDVEVLDVASVPTLVPHEVRKRYGVFGIYVETPWARGPHEFFDLPPETFRWLERGGASIAVKRYGPDVALIWLAGAERRLDERWRRLDRIVRRLR